jgi:isopentenyl-diphosphate delta-isomerase
VDNNSSDYGLLLVVQFWFIQMNSTPMHKKLNMEEKVILVDKKDKEIGIEEKMKAHQEGKLHRAFSIFIFNSKGDLLLQKRAKTKYHSGGLWTNTCCSHPIPKEPIEETIHRRLKEEMGFDCELKKVFSFIYKVNFKNGLSEHELDYVFIGTFDGEPIPNPKEAEGWRMVNRKELKKDIKEKPDKYTAWFKIVLNKLILSSENKF